MHDFASPHCSYCQHFESCFQMDMVVEWGYCRLKANPPAKELAAIKRKVEEGNYEELLARQKELGLYVPTITDCPSFLDLYPF